MLTKMNFTKELNLKQNALWNAAGCFFYLGCQWIITVLVVILADNFLDSGYLAFAMATGNVFAAVGLYKVRTYQVSDVNNEFSQNEYVGFRILTIAVSACASIIYIFASATSVRALLVSFSYLLFKADESFNDVNFGCAQKEYRMDFIGRSQFMRGLLSVGLFAAAMEATQSIEVAVLFMAFGGIVITCLYDIKYTRHFGFTKPEINERLVKTLVKDLTLPMLANLLATSIVSVSRQLYGSISGEEALGVYASIATPAVLVQAGISYIYSPLLGKIAEIYVQHDSSEFKIYLRKIYFGMLLIVIVGAVALYIPGKHLLLTMYGVRIQPYLGTFLYVLLATGGVALLYFVNDVLVIMRSRISQIIINSLAFLCCVLSVPKAVSGLGMNGLNLSIGLSTVLFSLLGYVVANMLSKDQ